MNDKQRRAYETSLAEHKKAFALAYKLGGGRLNDRPKRRAVVPVFDAEGRRISKGEDGGK